MNCILFENFGIPSLNSCAIVKIQPLPSFHSRSQKHVWKIRTLTNLKKLFSKWHLLLNDFNPTFKVLKKDSVTEEPLYISKFLINSQVLLEISYFVPTSKLIFSYIWVVKNIKTNQILDILQGTSLL